MTRRYQACFQRVTFAPRGAYDSRLATGIREPNHTAGSILERMKEKAMV